MLNFYQIPFDLFRRPINLFPFDLMKKVLLIEGGH